MNELVSTLSEKAKKKVPHGISVERWIFMYNEELAKLIIEECCSKVGDNEAIEIRKHFELLSN
jgi:hypothetical protein